MNETLLNLSLLKEQFDKYFEDKYVLTYWFTKLLHSSTVMGIVREYINFGELAEATLENLFYENSMTLTQETKAEILCVFKKLPAYDDVRPAIEVLKDSDVRAIAVSNSSLTMIKEQLTNAGIIDLFDDGYSVDAVSSYKPFNEIYQYASKQENLSVNYIAMVATHDWDLFGAKKAGLTTAYISRKKELFHALYSKADYYDSNLSELLLQIIKTKNNG